MTKDLSIDDFLDGFKAGDISILAKAITLIESTNQDHQKKARLLLKEIYPLTGKAKRIGVSGTPGVGKSTFLENYGLHLLDQGQKIAVLAIDPTSQVTGGSILGDKTRMHHLATKENAFIRPSPNGSSLGGVAAKTREAMLLCDAFGFDTIFIETVGVGQSEIAVSNIVDFFILLMQPGGGDELQGIKRGILEVSQLVLVNKADGNQLSSARIAQHEYKRSLEVLQEKKDWQAPVLLCSSLKKVGFEDIDKTVETYFSKVFKESHRLTQTKTWLKDLLVQQFKEYTLNSSKIDSKIDELIKSQADLLAGVNDIYYQVVNENGDN